jgi:uncharacterized repeat protein (TIGR03803 family)
MGHPAVGIQPQADHQLRIRVFAPSAAFDRCNLRIIETQVQSPYHFPKRTRTVILVDQLFNIDRAQQDLPAIYRNKSRSRRRQGILHTCSVRTFVDSAILLRSPSVDFFTASSPRFPSVEGENLAERWLRVGRVSAKSPTSRKEREKWGTRNLYGTTAAGGNRASFGTVFRLSGKKETVLHRFHGGDGKNPFRSPLMLDSDGTLYGVTYLGGAHGLGTVFSVKR